MNTTLTWLPDPITMESIEYDWLGRIKKIVFRPLADIKKDFPDFIEKRGEIPFAILKQERN